MAAIYLNPANTTIFSIEDMKAAIDNFTISKFLEEQMGRDFFSGLDAVKEREPNEHWESLSNVVPAEELGATRRGISLFLGYLLKGFRMGRVVTADCRNSIIPGRMEDELESRASPFMMKRFVLIIHIHLEQKWGDLFVFRLNEGADSTHKCNFPT